MERAAEGLSDGIRDLSLADPDGTTPAQSRGEADRFFEV